MNSFKKILKWLAVGLVVFLVGGFIILFIIREFHFHNLGKTEVEVAKIHNTKLTLDDVMGKNLPPDPGTSADATVAGVDANQNGIRDDVELAVFKAYPNSARTRAVLLQYALVLQTELTLSILNTDTATAIVEDNENRAHICIWSITSRDNMKNFNEITTKNENFVEKLQFNNQHRKEAQDNFSKYIRSYSASNKGCDLDLKTLPN